MHLRYLFVARRSGARASRSRCTRAVRFARRAQRPALHPGRPGPRAPLLRARGLAWTPTSTTRLRHAARGVPPLGDLAQLAGLDLVDEAADRVLLRDERGGLDARDRLSVTSASRSSNASRGPVRLARPCSSSSCAANSLVREGQHAAVRVVDEDDLLGAQQALGDRQRADLVVGDDAAGVADDVRVALLAGRARRRRSRRASMHATTATFLPGGSGSSPLSPKLST